ncbi:hypothetical protein L204_106125 [Cryptococcus depauperatus]|nr:hypothetical protein L204_05687 [Cryptococcus depauperatus CBS 7855]
MWRLQALVTASRPLGLLAFFPLNGTNLSNLSSPDKFTPKGLPPLYLSFKPTWYEAKFSLSNVISTTALPVKKVDLRIDYMEWLLRYLYVDGRSISHFHMHKNAEDITKAVWERGWDAKKDRYVD